MARNIGRVLLGGVGSMLLLMTFTSFTEEGDHSWRERLLGAAVCAALGALFLWLAFRKRDEIAAKATLRFRTVTAADLPGVDKARFEQWREAEHVVATAQKRGILWMVFATVVLVPLTHFSRISGAPPVVTVVFGALFFLVFAAWVAYMLVYVSPLGKKARRLGAEIGIVQAVRELVVREQSVRVR